MWKIIKENKLFFIAVLVFWVVCLALLITKSKADLHFMLNGYHTQFLNSFFNLYTNVGGWIPFVVAGGLLFYRFGAALLVLVPQLLVAIPIYCVKQFYDAPRPIAYFAKDQFEKITIADVDYNCTNSFPSGHTTAAFAMFLSLAIIVRNPILKILFVFLAIGVGYSRIYLSQHFAGDVFGGSIIGIVFATAYIYIQKRYAKPWMDQSLLSVGKKIINKK